MGTYQAYINWESDEEKKSCMGLRADLAQLGCSVGPVTEASGSPFGKPYYVVTYGDDIRARVEALCAERRGGGSVYSVEVNDRVRQSVGDGTARPEDVHELLSSNKRGTWLGPELSARPEFVRDEYENRQSDRESDRERGVSSPTTYPDGEKRRYGGIYGDRDTAYDRRSDLSYSINICQAMLERLNDTSSWRGSVSDYLSRLRANEKYQWPDARETIDYLQSLIDSGNLTVEMVGARLAELVSRYKMAA